MQGQYDGALTSSPPLARAQSISPAPMSLPYLNTLCRYRAVFRDDMTWLGFLAGWHDFASRREALIYAAAPCRAARFYEHEAPASKHSLAGAASIARAGVIADRLRLASPNASMGASPRGATLPGFSGDLITGVMALCR